jgi:uncharacterized Ntn-hydrolase superfamily protein
LFYSSQSFTFSLIKKITMKRCTSLLALIIFSLCFLRSEAQDTFSICAVDTVTGEVGSAGASCIDASAIAGGCVIISDVHPGVGVIHTQSYWLQANQNYARSLMSMGLSPQSIIDSLKIRDAQNNPAVRQYGIVDLSNGKARSAAFTGVNCMNYKNHIVGPNYAIQGNILLGQHILDSMEARFLRAPGDLACKLMEAMQGANVVGADTRCLSSGNSSLSSFLRVARPSDTTGTYTLDLVVPKGPAGFEPIDSLQKLFDNAGGCTITRVRSLAKSTLSANVFPNPSSGDVLLTFKNPAGETAAVEIYDINARLVRSYGQLRSSELKITVSGLGSGLFFYRIFSGTEQSSGRFIIR